MRAEYAIIVKNQTRLEILIERFNTKAQARFYIESVGGSFSDYEAEHEIFQQALLDLQRQLSVILKYKIVERKFVPSFIFSEKQVIFVIGQDGLVANTAKYAGNTPIIAINPDKKRYDGILLPFDTHSFQLVLEKYLLGKALIKETYFAEARLNDGQRLLGFNDLFIGASSHISARYKIQFENKVEEHSSSGLIVSTQAGSTGWMSSIFNMTTGLLLPPPSTRSVSKHEKKDSPISVDIPVLSPEELLFVVREPFASVRTQTGIVSGKLNSNISLRVESLMPAGGVIFSDGIEKDFMNFNSGAIATIGLAKEKARLIIG